MATTTAVVMVRSMVSPQKIFSPGPTSNLVITDAADDLVKVPDTSVHGIVSKTAVCVVACTSPSRYPIIAAATADLVTAVAAKQGVASIGSFD